MPLSRVPRTKRHQATVQSPSAWVVGDQFTHARLRSSLAWGFVSVPAPHDGTTTTHMNDRCMHTCTTLTRGMSMVTCNNDTHGRLNYGKARVEENEMVEVCKGSRPTYLINIELLLRTPSHIPEKKHTLTNSVCVRHINNSDDDNGNHSGVSI